MEIDKAIKICRNDITIKRAVYYGNSFDVVSDALEMVVNEVEQYRADIADGRLVRLPCKVGDSVYLLDNGHGEPVEAELAWWSTGYNGLIGGAIFGSGQNMKFTERHIGRTVFITREAAEAALAAQEVQHE